MVPRISYAPGSNGDGRWTARQRRGRVGRRETIRWYGMEEEVRKGSSSVRSFQGLEESEDNGGDGGLGVPERVADGNVDAKKSGETAEG